MSELWVRFVDEDFDAFEWWRFEDGQRPRAEGKGQGEALGQLDPAATCRLFLPQSLLLALSARLPPRASRQQLQAIGYAIEDQLANDVEDNHYAIGSQDEEGRLPVIVIRRVLMDRLLERLRAARLRCDALHAEMVLCPPPGEGRMATLCAGADGYLLRLSSEEALTLPRELLAQGLDWLAASQGREDLSLDCCRELDPPAVEGRSLDCRPIDCSPDRQGMGAAVNLLQGDYRPGSRWRERLRPWRSVAGILLALLLVLLVSALIERWQQQQTLQSIRQQQWALIDRYLPGQEHRGDPKRLLVKRLAETRQRPGQSGLLDLLADLAATRSAFPDLKIGRVLYRNGELVTDLEAPRLKIIEDLEQKLKQQALAFRIENLDIGPDRTRVRLILEGSS